MDPTSPDSGRPAESPVAPPGTVDSGLDDLLAAFQFLQGKNLQLAARLAAVLDIGATDLRVLLIINSSPGIGPKILATRLDLTTSSITALIDRQELVGRIERRQHPTDRRSQTLHLTSLGRDAVHEVRNTYLIAFDGLFSGSELRSAAAVLRTLGTAIAAHL